jgi:hypothetical protein
LRGLGDLTGSSGGAFTDNGVSGGSGTLGKTDGGDVEVEARDKADSKAITGEGTGLDGLVS